MTRCLPSLLLALLTGCASAPERQGAPEPVAIAGRAAEYRSAAPAPVEPGPVSLTTERIKPNEQLFGTTVQSGADTVNSAFTTASNSALTPAVTRLESSWTRELEGSDARLRVGDAISLTGGSSNPVRFAGVQLGANLDLREDVITSSRLATPGVAALPTSVDALFSGGGAAGSPLAKQGLTVQDRVQVVGANSISFVTRDSLGRSVNVTQPLLSGIRLAEPGCNSYAVDVGRVREDYAIKSNEYGQWFANTRVLCGVPLGFTLEGHGEYLGDQGGTVGVGLARRVSVLGTASVGLASSRGADESGWLARFGFEHTNRLFDVNVRTLVQSPGYQHMGTAASPDPLLHSTVASLGVNPSATSNLAVLYATETTQADVTAALVALTQRMRFGAFNSVTMTAGQSLAATARILSVYFSFTRSFGARTRRSSTLPDTLDLIRPLRLPE